MKTLVNCKESVSPKKTKGYQAPKVVKSMQSYRQIVFLLNARALDEWHGVTSCDIATSGAHLWAPGNVDWVRSNDTHKQQLSENVLNLNLLLLNYLIFNRHYCG